MPDDPCQDQRENLKNAIAQSIAVIGVSAATAPETLGLSVLVGLLVGSASGYAIATAHNQLARCLRDHGLTAQADTLDQVATQLEQELAALQTAADATVA
jgi:CheY-specific phosphatase CheX